MIVTMMLSACGGEQMPETSDRFGGRGVISGELKKWHTVTVDFSGPTLSDSNNSPNPFLDYRLQVLFTGPSGQVYNMPGFFDVDGNGSRTGDIWRVRSIDDLGIVQFVVDYRDATGNWGTGVFANDQLFGLWFEFGWDALGPIGNFQVGELSSSSAGYAPNVLFIK